MTTRVYTFFNNKGGVGKTSLIYHLAWMYADLGLRVVAVDLDPQANLTAAFLTEEQLEAVFTDSGGKDSIFHAVDPLKRGIGDIRRPKLSLVDENNSLAIIIGDLALSSFEDELSTVWPKCLDRDERSFRVMSAFWRVIQCAADEHHADLVLVDLGPNLGAINRAALIATDYVIVPLAPDLFSLQGLSNLGPTLRDWRTQWQERLERNPVPDLPLPSGAMQPIGYVVLQHSVRLGRPVKAYEKWVERIPQIYREKVLDQGADEIDPHLNIPNDPNALALLKNYASLVPMSQEAHTPMFKLTYADGAIGAHQQAVLRAYEDFKGLAKTIADKTDLTFP